MPAIRPALAVRRQASPQANRLRLAGADQSAAIDTDQTPALAHLRASRLYYRRAPDAELSRLLYQSDTARPGAVPLLSAIARHSQGAQPRAGGPGGKEALCTARRHPQLEDPCRNYRGAGDRPERAGLHPASPVSTWAPRWPAHRPHVSHATDSRARHMS